jgi:hypothetical protein
MRILRTLLLACIMFAAIVISPANALPETQMATPEGTPEGVVATVSDRGITAWRTLRDIYASEGEQAAGDYFDSLSKNLQQEVIALSMPVVSTTEYAVGKSEVVMEADGCYAEITRSKTWKSILGANLYRVSQTIKWCYSSSDSIYSPSCSATAEDIDFLWDVTGVDYHCEVKNGGLGESVIRYDSSYTLEGCIPFRSCFATEVEWIGQEGGDGTHTWWVS